MEEKEKGQQKSTIKDKERGRDKLCMGGTGGQEETNLEGRGDARLILAPFISKSDLFLPLPLLC